MAKPAPEAPEAALARLPPAMRAVGIDLLIRQALFAGPDLASLAERVDDSATRAVLRGLLRAAPSQSEALADALVGWSVLRPDLDEVSAKVRAALVDDLLSLKESGAEALLHVGMRAPTKELRHVFVELADADRRHADALRGLQGVRGIHGQPRPEPSGAPLSLGAHGSRVPGASLAQSIQRAIEDMVSDGQEISRITLSAAALRHARDEGALGPADGTMFGLSVFVDFGWRGECFALHTQDHASLAEILTARQRDL